MRRTMNFSYIATRFRRCMQDVSINPKYMEHFFRRTCTAVCLIVLFLNMGFLTRVGAEGSPCGKTIPQTQCPCSPDTSALDCASIIENWTSWLPNDGVATTDVAACGDSSVSGSSNEAIIWNYLSSKGLTAVAVAGIMGNMHQENSPFDPARKQNDSLEAASTDPNLSGAAFGIFQWDKGRRVMVMQALDAAGLSKYYGAGYGQADIDQQKIPSDDMSKLLSTELEFAWSGDSTKISDLASQLNAATSVEGPNGSAELFNSLYERSGDDAAQVQQRVNDAKTYLSKYGGTSGGCGALGGVAAVSDALAWAQKFVSDAESVGGASVTPINLKSADQIDVARIGATASTCWGTSCDQCTAVSAWFVNTMTDYTYGHGNGGEVVANLENLGVRGGNTPEPFSIFSTNDNSDSADGHTGLVLGVLSNGDVITLENNVDGNGLLRVHQYNIKQAYPDVRFAYVGDKLKQGVQQ